MGLSVISRVVFPLKQQKHQGQQASIFLTPKTILLLTTWW